MKRWTSVAATGLMLAGCAHGDRPASPSASVETIRYETSPCFGACPTYAVTVSSDGKGLFTGKRFTAVTGERAFAVSAAQYAAFKAALAPYRPKNGEMLYRPGSSHCQQVATDLPSVDIGWSGRGGGQHLGFYYGCDMQKNAAMAEALGNAPDVLPIAELIGERP